MRTLRAWLALSGLALLTPPAWPAQDTRPGVAVLPFENGGSYGRDREDFDALRRGIAGMVMSELGRNPAVRLVERERLQGLLDEQGLAAAERVDAATAARIGKLVGARYMIAGTFIDLYGDFRVDARIIDVETGEIVKVVRSDPKLTDRKQMFRIIQSVAERITEGTNLPPLPAAAAQAARARNVPTEALAFYSRALLYQDRGDKDRAIEFYNKAIGSFPEYTEAKDGLRRLRGS
jgi:TolB-like protein